MKKKRGEKKRGRGKEKEGREKEKGEGETGEKGGRRQEGERAASRAVGEEETVGGLFSVAGWPRPLTPALVARFQVPVSDSTGD